MIPFKIGLLSAQLGAVRQMRTSLLFLGPSQVSGSKKVAPLGESGGTGLLKVVAV
jgi:hypothetical protein